MSTPVTIAMSAVWVRRIGNRVEVLIERPVLGWQLAITVDAEASFSHIAEARGASEWEFDPLLQPLRTR